MQLVDSFKRFTLILLSLIVAAFSVVIIFDQLIAAPINLDFVLVQTGKTLIVFFFGAVILFFIRHSKPLMAKRVGVHPATVFQFFMFLAVGIVMIFATLHIFRFEPTALLAGGGIVSIVMGLAVSTFVGNILAGTMVLMTHPYKEGDTVMINNVPGRVIEMSGLVTRIRNDIGGEIVIPNTAIAQGAVIVTKIPPNATVSQTRLPYSLGDRVCTTYMNEEGIVKELSPFHTKILLNSGRELTLLNTSILTGAVAVAKISSAVNEANQPR